MYSGLEDLEEDSKQLQFSFVQSSGTDPVLDIMPDSVSYSYSHVLCQNFSSHNLQISNTIAT